MTISVNRAPKCTCVFSDGVLFRIAPDDSWEVLAADQAMPDSLVVGPRHACWRVTPAQGFEVACLDLDSRAVKTVLRDELNILAYTLHEDMILWVVLTQGTFRASLP